MGSFKLGGMTLKSIFTKPETTLYPVMEKPAPDGLKGHIENNMDLCILCGICVKTCPAGALRVEKQENLWAINRFACVQCGACTRACPKKCLAMDPAYQKPLAQKTEDVFYKPQSNEEDKAAKEAEKAARIEAAKAAKAAREQAAATQ